MKHGWALLLMGAGAAGVLLLLMALADEVQAHKGAQGVVKERMKLMMRAEKRMRPIARMAAGRRAFDAEIVRRNAQDLMQYAERLPTLFPSGSLKTPSEAAPAIWQRFDDFRQQAENMRKASQRLMQADTKTLPAALQELQQACKSCHRQYRIERN